MKKSMLALAFFSAVTFANAGDEPPHHGGINHSENPHHLSVLLADTHISGHGNGVTVGLDYEYRLNDRVGVGAVVEYAGGDLDAWTFLAAADIHITPQWILQVGPGHEHSSGHNLFVARIGTLYEFELDGDWTVAPQLHWDYHENDENAIVYGIAVGKAF